MAYVPVFPEALQRPIQHILMGQSPRLEQSDFEPEFLQICIDLLQYGRKLHARQVRRLNAPVKHTPRRSPRRTPRRSPRQTPRREHPAPQEPLALAESRSRLPYFESQRLALCGQAALNHLFQNYVEPRALKSVALFTTNARQGHEYMWSSNGRQMFDLYKFCQSRKAAFARQHGAALVRELEDSIGCETFGNFDVELLQQAVELMGYRAVSLSFRGERGAEEALLRALEATERGRLLGLIVNIRQFHYTAVLRSPEGPLVELDSMIRPRNLMYGPLFSPRAMLQHLTRRGYAHAFTVSLHASRN